jgi:hypothetical protein
VRVIQGRILPLLPILSSSKEAFSALVKLSQSLKGRDPGAKIQFETKMQNLLRQNTSFVRNARFLSDKTSQIAQLLSDILSLKNQSVAQEQNTHLCEISAITQQQNTKSFKMTGIMLRDSATIKVIAVVTLIYLPGTFVSVSKSIPEDISDSLMFLFRIRRFSAASFSTSRQHEI